jgi:hypothetical protein
MVQMFQVEEQWRLLVDEIMKPFKRMDADESKKWVTKSLVEFY